MTNDEKQSARKAFAERFTYPQWAILCRDEDFCDAFARADIASCTACATMLLPPSIDARCPKCNAEHDRVANASPDMWVCLECGAFFPKALPTSKTQEEAK